MDPLWLCKIGCISIKWSIENDICPKGERIYFLDPSIRAGGRSENLKGASNRLPTISAPNISAREISAQTFHHRDISARARFSPVGVLAYGHFVSVDVSVQELFGTGTFRHKDFSAPWTFWHRDISAHVHFGTCTFQHVHGDKISMCRYVCRAETCPCQNVSVMKCPSRIVSYRNVRFQNSGKPSNNSSFQEKGFASISI